MDVFAACQEINESIIDGDDETARDELIKLLDYLQKNGLEYGPIVNHLIRQVGLYPYIQTDSANWQDRFVYESFKVDIGLNTLVTLHREQSSILKKLVAGKSLALSAPTSFGKSFIIDSFISITEPRNVVIIVPTIALTDETRRRLQRKFADKYKIITTSDVELGEKNIFVFPQERAIQYSNKIDPLDMLVIDEFYKASPEFDKERSPALLKAIIRLGEKAKQRYFLAPNISKMNDNVFAEGIEFFQVDFNTVYLEKHNLFSEIGKDENKKSEALIKILRDNQGKSMIYAGTYSNIDKVSSLILGEFGSVKNDLLDSFGKWLSINYGPNWQLPNLIKRGCGIHNGRLHRSLSQIQVRLFEESNGINWLITTSSIVEGVNTSAENIVIWKNKNGVSRLNNFTYKNIIGRGGRMFKHFIGKIYILEQPPAAEQIQLSLEIPDKLLGEIDENSKSVSLTNEQKNKIIEYKAEMNDLLGEDIYTKLLADGLLESSDSLLIRDIARSISSNPEEWNGLGYLNSANTEHWDRHLYKIIRLKPDGWGVEHRRLVEFIKVLTGNWTKSIPELLDDLDAFDIGIEEFFHMERTASYKLAALLSDVNVLQRHILDKSSVDISAFVSKVANAFLPATVFQLEEYGLPRMISKKIHNNGLINFTDSQLTLHEALDKLREINASGKLDKINNLDDFDRYMLAYFYDGV